MRLGGAVPAALLAASLSGCASWGDPVGEVVVYVSEDQVFSEPILKDFERESGIRVRAVYDTEEAKSTGVMNRLLAEKGNPQADVYWANEPIRAELLKQQGVSEPYRPATAQGIPEEFKDPDGHWTGFSARVRLLVVHSDVAGPPQSIQAFADPPWKGRGVLANPLFGTTTTHVAALFEAWGDEAARNFMGRIRENQTKLSSSNGESADLVASGEFAFSLVDSDDAISRKRQGRPIRIVFPDQGEDELGCLVLPNAAVLIRGGPNPENAGKLMDYLVSAETERKLALSEAAQIPLHPGLPAPAELQAIEELKVLQIDYAAVARRLQQIQPFLKDWAGY